MADTGRSRSRRPRIFISILAVGTVFLLYAPQLYWPMIQMDDFPILAESWTWTRARENLWKPFNEHVMPLARLSTWAIGRTPTTVPILTALQGPIAVAIGMWLLYVFMRGERNSTYLGMIAAIVFGVTTAFHEAVAWYAAGFTILALDTTLLALQAAQRWRHSQRWIWLVCAAGLCAVAPGWFATGILAGPLVSIYLLLRRCETTDRDVAAPGRWMFSPDCLVPLAGTVLFLAVALPRNAQHILHLEHYSGRTAVEAFNLPVGLVRTARALVDHLMLGSCGISISPMPAWVVVVGLCGLGIAAVWWWRNAPRRDLLVLGAAFILCSDVLIHSARALWPYDMVHGWTRYDVFPHAGLVFIICGGLRRPAESTWTARQIKGLVCLCLVLLLVNLPRGLSMGLRLASWEASARPVEQITGRWHAQRRVLQEIESVDAFCRTHAIDAASARDVLVFISVPECADCNGWLLLRGSDSNQPADEKEARRLLMSFRQDR